MAEDEASIPETGYNSSESALSVGQQLRSARLDQGLTISEVAQELHLSEAQITALETEAFGRLQGEPYIRGSLRNYAGLVGLDPETVLRSYKRQYLEYGEGLAPGRNSLTRTPSGISPGHPWRVILASSLLILLLGLLAFLGFGQGKIDRSTHSSVGSSAGGQGGPESNPTARANEPEAPGRPLRSKKGNRPTVYPTKGNRKGPSQAKGASSRAESRSATASMAPDPVSLRLQTSQEAWLEVTDARGHRLLWRLVPAGEEIRLHGHPPFEVKTGNAGGIQLYYRGEPVPALGEQGEVVQATIPGTSS